MKRPLSILALTVLIVALAGCQSQKPVEGPREGYALRDLPIPEGFEYHPDKSFAKHTNFRASTFFYDRRERYDSRSELIKHFEKEAPKLGWKVRFVVGLEKRHMFLEKGNESCEISLSRKIHLDRTILVVKRSTDLPASHS